MSLKVLLGAQELVDSFGEAAPDQAREALEKAIRRDDRAGIELAKRIQARVTRLLEEKSGEG
ncbi:MAG: hypothetical protein ACPGNT_00100 [Rhodospirillales bacterium]